MERRESSRSRKVKAAREVHMTKVAVTGKPATEECTITQNSVTPDRPKQLTSKGNSRASDKNSTPSYANATIASKQKRSPRCKDEKINSSTPSQDQFNAKHMKGPNKEASNKEIPKTKSAKKTKDEKDDKRRTDTEKKCTKDKKRAREDVSTYGNHEHPKRYNDLQHQQENNASKRSKHLEEDNAKKEQEALEEELKNCQERCKVLEAQLAEAKNELSAKSKEVETYQANIDELLKKEYHLSLCKIEERNFKLTNEFTSAGEGSVLDISNRYRHLQHNIRPAAVRAMKKICKIDFKEHICSQVMCAYDTAKAITLHQASSLIEKVLFELQPVSQDPVMVHDKELLQTCMILLGHIQNDETINTAAITEIKKTLMNHSATLLQRESLPSEVEDYYQSLSELMWCAVARPIPMITAKSPDTYCKSYHELNDEDDDIEDSRAISYVYPVLYTSNKSPRELAQKGKVVLKRQS